MKQIKADKTETNSHFRNTRRRSLKHETAILFALLFILAALVPDLIITSVTAAQTDKSIKALHAAKQKVLVLHSYHNAGWTRTIQEGMESVFDKSGIAVEMCVEYMDTMRHPPKDSFAYLEDLYRKKYGHISFDVILLSDDNALDFILPRRDKLFPKVPIVFCGINDFREEQLHGQSGITGVNEDIDIKGTIELASRIMPNIKKFLVISDRTPTGLANRRKFEQALSGYSGKAPVFELLDDLTTVDLQKHLGRLSHDSAVLLFTFKRDKDGRLFTQPEYVKLVVGSSNVPVFSFWETDLPYGVMGGVMVSGVKQGEQSAEYAIRILKGEPASSLPFIMKSPNVPILDYPQLRKFNIPKEVIPAEVSIRNEPITFYYRYKTTIWLTSFFIISLVFVNIILLINIARRKRTEEALRESEDKYRSLFENSMDAVLLTAPDGIILAANPGACRIFGRTEEEICRIGRAGLLDLKDPRLEVALEERERAGRFRGELTFIRKDGSSFAGEISTVIFRDRESNPKTSMIIRDMTEHKQAEEELQASKAQLSNALEMANLGHWEYDVASDLFTFNDQFYKIFRTTVEQIGGYTMHSAEYARRFVHPDDMQVVEQEIRKAIEATDPHFNRQIEHRMLYADGKVGYITVRFFIVKDNHGRTVKTYGVNQDITERKRAEDALRESEEKFKYVFDRSIIGKSITLPSGEMDANQAFAEMLGVSFPVK